jgi:hypothetical protein
MTVRIARRTGHVDERQYDKEWFRRCTRRSYILDALLKAGYPIESVNSSGYTALILADPDQPESSPAADGLRALSAF